MCIFKLLCEAFVMFHTLSQLSYTVHVISFSNDSFTHHFLFIYFHVPPQTTHFHVLFIHMKFFTLIYFHTRFSPAGSFNIIFDSPPMNHLFTWDCFFSCDFFYRLLIYFNVIFFPVINFSHGIFFFSRFIYFHKQLFLQMIRLFPHVIFFHESFISMWFFFPLFVYIHKWLFLHIIHSFPHVSSAHSHVFHMYSHNTILIYDHL